MKRIILLLLFFVKISFSQEHNVTKQVNILINDLQDFKNKIGNTWKKKYNKEERKKLLENINDYYLNHKTPLSCEWNNGGRIESKIYLKNIILIFKELNFKMSIKNISDIKKEDSNKYIYVSITEEVNGIKKNEEGFYKETDRFFKVKTFDGKYKISVASYKTFITDTLEKKKTLSKEELENYLKNYEYECRNFYEYYKYKNIDSLEKCLKNISNIKNILLKNKNIDNYNEIKKNILENISTFEDFFIEITTQEVQEIQKKIDEIQKKIYKSNENIEIKNLKRQKLDLINKKIKFLKKIINKK